MPTLRPAVQLRPQSVMRNAGSVGKPLNLRHIRVRYNNGSEKGRVIVKLCDEINRLRRKNTVLHLTLTQVVQLYRKKRHKEAA